MCHSSFHLNIVCAQVGVVGMWLSNCFLFMIVCSWWLLMMVFVGLVGGMGEVLNDVVQ